jgi:ABC-type Co2+ transport system permease subunit
MLIYNGGILGIVGQIIWIIFKAAFTLLTVPMMVAGIVSPYDPGTHYISQAVVMAVVSGIIFKFRKNVKKPIVSTLGFLAICTSVSVGLVATNADLWSQFQMFPNL